MGANLDDSPVIHDLSDHASTLDRSLTSELSREWLCVD